MSPLAAFFVRHPTIKRSAFARQAKVTPGRITQLCNGETPSLELAMRIYDLTGKEVAPSDWPRPSPAADREAAA